MKSVFSPKIIFIVGPTAVGKTGAALQVANQIPCEVVSCDSMQVYRKISIASSKPSAVEQKRVPHHLLDVVSVEEKFDVAAFNKLAAEAIEKILGQKKYPLVVGGSGMYMQVLLDGIFEAGGQDPSLRKKLESLGAEKLYGKLKQVDPDAASKIHANDLRRIVRALEVYETTKTPISTLQKQRSGLLKKYPAVIVGLNRERDELYQRINERVEEMFTEGLVNEVKAIAGSQMSLTAQRIIGVSEVMAYLRGEKSLEEAKELMKMNTRRLAKRQLTWFRKDQRIKWLMLKADDTAKKISQDILKEINL
ncbi:MAG: tRNA (adenosine(37)-N6)-dimethylallyltransferase MiaA [Candidatus Omnitrophica bacterium]|nr:tRNA (adenosine(37)-N6)-dimethylallyltransferase MiaA [Candidatus Omnitrophota bacterium]